MHRAVIVVAVYCSLMIAGCSQGPVTSPPLGLTQRPATPQITRYKVLNNFNGADEGSHPTGSIAPLRNLLYGTASDGGKYGFGVIFRARPDGRDNYPLHYFDGKQEGCTPLGGVTHGTANMFYGTTASCGNASQGGTVWSEHASSRQIHVMHAFDLGKDGGNPQSAPALIGTTLYGTTPNGGANGKGTLYSVDINTDGFSVLHTFGTENDAGNPVGRLIELGGKLFGTSSGGGSDRAGTVFEFDPKNGKEKVVHSFDRTDGARPTAALLSWGGMLYGVTPTGGVSSAGTIFKIDPASGYETVLYNFGDGDAIDPDGSLVVWKDALYGTTRRGGKGGADYGTIYRYTPATKSFEELYTFAGEPDGARPRGGLVFLHVDGLDQFFGTTYAGGKNDLGTIFTMTP